MRITPEPQSAGTVYRKPGADRLHLDFESKSEVNLKMHGLMRYARHKSTKVLMLAWGVNDEPVQQWIPHRDGPHMPERLRRLLNDPKVELHAFNCRFERMIFKHVLDMDLPLERWHDTMIKALQLSLPGDLATLGEVIDVADAKKMKGKDYIKLFCVPALAREVKKHGKLFNNWETHPTEWALFVKYNERDVVAERTCYKRLRRYFVPDVEREIWLMDEAVHERGMPIDVKFMEAGYQMVVREKKRKLDQLKKITGLANANSGDQLLPWLQERGYPFENLKKESVAAALKDFDFGPLMKQALTLKRAIAQTSVDKYRQFRDTIYNGWISFAFQYGGASRTLRWAGKKPQLHNLASRFAKKWHKNLDEVRQMIMAGDDEGIRMMYGEPLEALKACIRTMIHAPEGMTIVCADLGSIESRGAGEIANCEGIKSIFRDGRDMYKVFASYLYKIAYDAVTKDQRDFCKPPVLGSQYGLGPGDERGDYPLIEYTGLIAYGKNMGVDISKPDAERMTELFRRVWVEVPNCWYAIDEAVIRCLHTKKRQRVVAKHPKTREYNKFPLDLWIDLDGPFLRILLPSGRYLYYLRPQRQVITKKSKRTGEKYDSVQISYEGYNDKRRWTRIDSWGGKFIENIIQAWARDILAFAMLRIVDKGFTLLGSVHDEAITMVPLAKADRAVKILPKILAQPPPHPCSVPLTATSFQSLYYKKD